MAISAQTMDELLKLPADERRALAEALLDGLDDDDDEIPDRELLMAELERSEEDERAGRVRPAREVIAELRAKYTKAI